MTTSFRPKLNLDDNLVRAVRIRAALRGESMNDLIEHALRAWLEEEDKRVPLRKAMAALERNA